MGRAKSRVTCLLGEDEFDLIVDKLSDAADRKSFSEVCKSWYQLERLNRSSLRLLAPGFFVQVLQRFPNLVQFETAHYICDNDLKFLSRNCPKLEVVNLNTSDPRTRQDHVSVSVLGAGVVTLAAACPKLSKLMLNWRYCFFDSVLISSAHNLKHLELEGSLFVSDQYLQAIGSSNSISYLNLACCFQITDVGLDFLANGSVSKTLKTLILDKNNITDVGVSHLRKMHCLDHLSLAGCSRHKITDIGGVAISSISTLITLRLNKLRVSDRTLVALARNCLKLEMVDLSGCSEITGAGILAFSGHARLQTIVWPSCEPGPCDLEHLMRTCPLLKSIRTSSL